MNKNSKLLVCNTNTTSQEEFITHIETTESAQNQILQIAQLTDIIIIEYISRLEEEMTAPCGQPQHDIDFENYLDTIINRDPFGAKYSNQPIKAVFEAGDKQWLDTALKNMKNEFIRERLQYIVERGGYGKIKC